MAGREVRPTLGEQHCSGVRPTGLPVSGVILADRIKSLDWRARRVEYVCSLPASTVDERLAKAPVLVSTTEGQA